MTDGYKVKKVIIRQNGVERIVRPTVPATAISLDKSSISLTTAGQTSQIIATLTPADSTSTVSWTSSNTSIATVSSTGLVTCVTPGTCTITATTSNGLTATCGVSASRLPSAYQEVEYIQSSGTQYLNTGILGENKYIMDAKFMFTALSGADYDDTLIGASGSSRPSYMRFIQKRGCAGNNYWSQMIGSSYGNSRGTPYANTTYTVKAQLSTSGNYLTVNGTTYTWSYSSSYNCGYNMYIFGSNNAGTFGNQASIRLFYLKISNLSETPVREFIPCYRKSDNIIGMYDLVNNQFYTNTGSGTFTKGPNVN